MTDDPQAIEAVLDQYRDALCRADPDAVAALYTPDAVLMAPEAPPVVGVEAIRSTYRQMSEAIGIEIRFTIAEVQVLAPEWAFARTTSAGALTIKASGTIVPEANQELFLFQKRQGAWKIARYSFSVTQPAQP